MDTMLIFNHYINYLAVNQTREAPRGNPSGSASETGFRQHPALVSFLSSLLQEKKLILMISAHALNRKQ